MANLGEVGFEMGRDGRHQRQACTDLGHEKDTELGYATDKKLKTRQQVSDVPVAFCYGKLPLVGRIPLVKNCKMGRSSKAAQVQQQKSTRGWTKREKDVPQLESLIETQLIDTF